MSLNVAPGHMVKLHPTDKVSLLQIQKVNEERRKSGSKLNASNSQFLFSCFLHLHSSSSQVDNGESRVKDDTVKTTPVTQTEEANENITFLAGALVAWSPVFKIYCGRCWFEARVKLAGASAYDLAVRSRAAAELYRLGWRYHEPRIVCPKCARQ